MSLSNHSNKDYSDLFNYYIKSFNQLRLSIAVLLIALLSLMLGLTIDFWGGNRLILDSVIDIELFSHYLVWILPTLCLMIYVLLRRSEPSHRLHYTVLIILVISLSSVHAASLTQSLTLSPVSLVSITLLAKVVIVPPIYMAILIVIYLGSGMIIMEMFQYSLMADAHYFVSLSLIFSWLFYLGIDNYHAKKKQFFSDKQLWRNNQKVAFQHAEMLAKSVLLKELALKDKLTNLYNRHYFEKQFVVEQSRLTRADMDLSLLMIDIDHFKLVNDNLGHQVGDQYIKTVAATLLAIFNRQSDIVARYGGEEFIVLLPHTNSAGLKILTEKTLEAIHSLQLPHPVSQYLSVSIGGVSVKNGQHDLINIADDNLYHVKKNGRNDVCLSDL